MSGDLDFDIVELAPWVPDSWHTNPLFEVAFRSNAWLPREDALLRALFAADRPFDQIAAELGRGRAGVADRAWKLGLRRTSRQPWNDLEDQLLHERYGTVPAADLAQALGRSCSSIYVRAQLLGLSEKDLPRWSEWELAQLREGYAQALPVGIIAQLIGRTMSATGTRAYKMGLRHPHQPGDWTDAEVARALELAEVGHLYLTIREMLANEGFPSRSKNGFGQRIRKLGYGRGWGKPWLPEEEELLRHAYRTGASLTPIRTRLGRTSCSIRWKAKDLGLQGTHVKTAGFRQGPVWTKKEEDFLRDNYGKMPTRQLAEALNRPRMGVLNRAWHLGLKHGYWRPYTEDELRAYRLAYAHGIAIADLAIALDREAMTVSKYATDKLHLHFGRRRRMRPAPTLDQILQLERERDAA